MKTMTLNLPTLGAIAASRVLLGVGVGLLLSNAIPRDRRRSIGLTLLGAGVASTFPLAAIVFRGDRRAMTS